VRLQPPHEPRYIEHCNISSTTHLLSRWSSLLSFACGPLLSFSQLPCNRRPATFRLSRWSSLLSFAHVPILGFSQLPCHRRPASCNLSRWSYMRSFAPLPILSFSQLLYHLRPAACRLGLWSSQLSSCPSLLVKWLSFKRPPVTPVQSGKRLPCHRLLASRRLNRQQVTRPHFISRGLLCRMSN
jgi:hypothetical protein